MKAKLAFPLLALVCAACTKPSTGNKGAEDVGIAVISSDYMSSVVSLINAAGDKLSQDDCLDSGSTTPVLSEALSGDVVLASQPQLDHDVLLIDQSNSALISLDPTNCTVLDDLSVGVTGSSTFYANPHDVVGISTTKSYVTRNAQNPTPSGTPGAHDLGNDVLIINPATQTITGSIDVSSAATVVTGATGPTVAMPDRAVLANGLVYVSLNNISADYSTIGTGAIAIIDPTTDQLTGSIQIPNDKNCSALSYFASNETLLVACGGDYNQDLATQTGQSAVIAYDVSGDAPVLINAISGTAMGNQPVSNSALAAVSDTIAIAVASGSCPPTSTGGDCTPGSPPDATWSVDFKTGATTSIATADGAFVIGGVVYDAQSQHALVTDAGTTNPRVIVYDVSKPTAITAVTSFASDPKAGLPPRYISGY